MPVGTVAAEEQQGAYLLACVMTVVLCVRVAPCPDRSTPPHTVQRRCPSPSPWPPLKKRTWRRRR